MDTTIEAAGVRFESCQEFRSSAEDLLICACGWLEDDHGELAAVRVRRRLRRREVAPAELRAS
jgi:hypothetical protein